MRNLNRTTSLRTTAIAIVLPAVFAVFSSIGCNGCNDSTTSTEATSTGQDTTTVVDSSNMPSLDSSSGKGDQTVPPPKKP
jgi:hypothetical protein